MNTAVLVGLLQSLLVVLLPLVSSTPAQGDHYFSGEHELNEFLVKSSIAKQKEESVTVTLNSSVTHVLSSRQFISTLRANAKQSFSIQSDSPYTPAHITCQNEKGTSNNHTNGIAFVNFGRVMMNNLIFSHCGATLNQKALKHINDSDIHFDRNASAVLLFNHCGHVLLTNISVYQYRGFAVVGANILQNSTFNTMTVSQLGKIEKHVSPVNSGSGVLILYVDSNLFTEDHNPLLTLNANIYRNNRNNLDYPKCQTNTYGSNLYSVYHRPIYYAGGLTIIYNQQNITVQVHIVGSTFAENYGGYAAAMLVEHLNSHAKSQTTITGTHFLANTIKSSCHGSGLVFFTFFSYDQLAHVKLHNHSYDSLPHYTLLSVTASSFTNHSGDKGAVYLAVTNQVIFQVNIVFKKVSFISNQAKHGDGVCMFASTYNQFDLLNTGLEIALEDMTGKQTSFAIVASFNFNPSPFLVSNNSQELQAAHGIPTSSIFTFRYVKLLNITGSELSPSEFSRNFGSVIELLSTDIHLQGHLTFTNNHAYDGAAIKMISFSHIKLGNNLTASFINNTAQQQGGAIYADTHQRVCLFQIRNYSNYNTALPNPMLHFVNNFARQAGNAIFADPIFNCYMFPADNLTDNTQLRRFYDSLFHFQSLGQNGNYELSTAPVKLVPCTQNNNKHTEIKTFPGKTIRVKLKALTAAALNQTAYTVVYTTPGKWNGNGKHITNIPQWWFSHGQEVQVIREDQSCTTLNITIRTSNDNCTQSENKDSNSCQGVLIFSLPNRPGAFTKRVKVQKCPMGFSLKPSTGICECSRLLQTFDQSARCNIQSHKIHTPSLANYWLGEVSGENGTKRIGIALNCPLSLCNTSLFGRRPVLHLNKKTGKLMYMCLNNRHGVLCGRCKPGYSVGMNTDKCLKCTNWWLFTLLAYLASGIVLILALYCLRLTLAVGTLNGFLFYTNCSFTELLDFLIIKSGIKTLDAYSSFSSAALRVPNLALGHAICMYDGLTEVGKVTFQFSYPLYLLLVIGLLTLISCYSLRVSRYLRSSTIQVFVTVMHLSFLRMLLTVTDVFTPAYVYTESSSSVVWARNGTILYFESEHRILVLVSSSVMLLFLLPYLAMLIVAKPLKCIPCIHHQIQAVLDVFHAPYKQKYKRWFVFRLIMQIALIILYTCLRQNDYYLFGIISGVALVNFIVVQAYVKPFKNALINVLDLWLMVNFAVATITVWYFFHKKQLTTIALLTCNILITLIIVTFAAILVYHILWVTGCLERMTEFFTTLQRSFSNWRTKRKMTRATLLLSFRPAPGYQSTCSNDNYSPGFSPCSQLREPILGINEENDS